MWTALVGKEFVARLQGKLTYVLLTIVVMLFTALLLGSFWMLVVSVPTIIPVIGSSVGTGPSTTVQTLVAANRGAFLFYALAICLLAAIFTIAPAVASSAISSERENDTLDLLLLAGRRARSVVVGKLTAAMLFVLLLCTTAVPAFSIAWMFGGVSARDVGLTLLVVVCTLAAITAVGLLCSTLARSSTLAALYTYTIVYFVAIGSLAIYLIGAALQTEATVRPLLTLNPFVALLTIPDSVTTALQQVLPFQFRPALELAGQDWLGLPLRYPRWVLTVIGCLLATVLLSLGTGLAIDPCHRWRTRDRTQPRVS
jgi:ABC-type transport system involved in multi-copper enzyme maturation permease subunit